MAFTQLRRTAPHLTLSSGIGPQPLSSRPSLSFLFGVVRPTGTHLFSLASRFSRQPLNSSSSTWMKRASWTLLVEHLPAPDRLLHYLRLHLPAYHHVSTLLRNPFPFLNAEFCVSQLVALPELSSPSKSKTAGSGETGTPRHECGPVADFPREGSDVFPSMALLLISP